MILFASLKILGLNLDPALYFSIAEEAEAVKIVFTVIVYNLFTNNFLLFTCLCLFVFCY